MTAPRPHPRTPPEGRDRDKATAKALGTFVREARNPTKDTADKQERDEQGA